MRRFALLGLLVWLTTIGQVTADEPVALRIGSFMVAPAHMPPAIVWIRNLRPAPYEGTVRLKVPDGWRYAPPEQEVSLAPGETKRLAFTIKQGLISEANSYPIQVSAAGAGTTVTRRQNVVCASAPYFKPEIDGDPDDWKDAIPVAFTSGGKKTVISTYWNRRQFSILVSVEEDELVAYQEGATRDGFDAVQLAISPQGTRTGSSPNDEAGRYEFLFVSTGNGTGGKCFRLAEPGMKLSEGQKVRALSSAEFDKAKIAVSRKEGITYYECGIPFRSMPGIKASEGREFFLSVLVHDPDGTGVRDWGQAAGMWPSQRNRLAWSQWQGSKWPDKAPFDNKTLWGMCSSKY